MTNRLRSFLLAGAVSLGLGAFAPAHALLALDTSDFVFIESITGSTGTFTISNLPLDIGPGASSNKFTFSLPVGSTPYFSVVNSLGGDLTSFTPTGSVPEPSTWAMLIAGFGFLGWRYGLRRGSLRRIFRTA